MEHGTCWHPILSPKSYFIFTKEQRSEKKGQKEECKGRKVALILQEVGCTTKEGGRSPQTIAFCTPLHNFSSFLY